MAYNKYHEGKIYRLLSPSRPDLIYYGSTILTLQKRFSQHKYHAKKCNISSKILIDCGDPIIELIEDYPCESKIELLLRERRYIENNKCVNKCIPTRTMKEQYEIGRTQRKEHYEKNKDRLIIKQTKYREQHKDIINQKKKEKYTCVCGSIAIHHHKARHERTQRHIDFISTIDI